MRKRWCSLIAVGLLALTSCTSTVAGSAVAAPAGSTAITGSSAAPSSTQPSSPPSSTQPSSPQSWTQPPATGVGHLATASVDAAGVITIATGHPQLILDEYEDPLCPPCATFWGQFGAAITVAVLQGRLALRLHVVNFLDLKSASGSYSTRAYASMLTVAKVLGDQQAAALTWQGVVFSSIIQPKEGGDSDLDNTELSEVAQGALGSEAARAAIAAGSEVAAAKGFAAQHWAELVKVMQTPSVPATLVKGKVIDTSRADWLTELLRG